MTGIFKVYRSSVGILLAMLTITSALSGQTKPIKFVAQFIAAESFESVGIIDVDNDGRPDLVSGDFWYKNDSITGMAFKKRIKIGDQARFDEYYDDFSTIPMDVNSDGRIDFISGGWFGKTIRWVENTDKKMDWQVHIIANTGNVETIEGWDVDGDGKLDIVPNTPNDSLHYFRNAGDGKFVRYNISDVKSHGLGFGDVNDDGRKDFIVSKGWVENKGDNQWRFHPDFVMDDASIPILVVDVNNDKKNDLIAGSAHGYGLFWYEQQLNSSGIRIWRKHVIDTSASQFHTMKWKDINDDGKPELITGKRYRAHNDGDPGANDKVGLYYYVWDGKKFVKNNISYGPAGIGKGTGIYFDIADLRGTGRKDIVVAGKDGLWVFFNEGK